MLFELPENGEHGDVGLAGAGGRADEEIFVGLVGGFVDDGLNPV